MEDLSNDVVVHIKKNGVEYIQFRRLLQYPEIQHCYTLRKSNLNFKIYENDDSFLKNSYDAISKAIEIEPDYIVKPHQTHTDRIEEVTSREQVFEEIDGIMTNNRDIVLCTTSADCTSLLFYDPIKRVIADVHSGWRGTVQRIAQKAVKKMIQKYGCNPENIICCICPHIRKCHFEVENDVMQIFKREFKSMEEDNQVIQEGRCSGGVQKYNIDTTLINIAMLKEVGLKKENIIDSEICTVCYSNEFHSYRVDKELSGRNAAIICLK